MKFSDYQKKAICTDRIPANGNSEENQSITVPMLGLAGEAGQLLTEYKKNLRDGEAHKLYKERVSEELGDLLWYISNIATKFELNLDEIASENLEKTKSRWGEIENVPQQFDADFSAGESLPRQFQAELREVLLDGHRKVEIHVKGKNLDNSEREKFGDYLTDNSYDPDGYRFHDVFHFAYAALLGWSPVTRKFLERKRKTDASVDEVEDGGRASAIEEGISALIFEYARRHQFLKVVSTVDSQLLRTIQDMTSNLEVRRCTAREWEQAILEGFKVWRLVYESRGGFVEVNLDSRTIQYQQK